MALSIVSDKPLDELASLVEDYFSSIKGKPSKGLGERPLDEIFLDDGHKAVYNEEKLPAFVQVKPLKDFKSLNLVFPTPSYRKLYGEKPYSYIAKLIGHEGKGSLLSYLKEKNLATGLFAG